MYYVGRVETQALPLKYIYFNLLLAHQMPAFEHVKDKK